MSKSHMAGDITSQCNMVCGVIPCQVYENDRPFKGTYSYYVVKQLVTFVMFDMKCY